MGAWFLRVVPPEQPISVHPPLFPESDLAFSPVPFILVYTDFSVLATPNAYFKFLMCV